MGKEIQDEIREGQFTGYKKDMLRLIQDMNLSFNPILIGLFFPHPPMILPLELIYGRVIHVPGPRPAH